MVGVKLNRRTLCRLFLITRLLDRIFADDNPNVSF
jgi:hypothetical protein